MTKRGLTRQAYRSNQPSSVIKAPWRMAYSMDLISIHSYTRQLITALNAFEIIVIADASYKEILPMDGFRHFHYFVNVTNELKHIVKRYVRLSDLNSLPNIGHYRIAHSLLGPLSMFMLQLCFCHNTLTRTYNRLVIYRGYICYNSAHSTTITIIKLRSNLHYRTTPRTSPYRRTMGCPS